MLDDFDKTFTIETENEFVLKKDLLIKKKNMSKTFLFTFDKRRILSDLSTVPWGHTFQKKQNFFLVFF